MKIRLRGSTYLFKIGSILTVIITLWNCKNEDYGILTTNEHTSSEEYRNPFQKMNYKELINDTDFGQTISLLEKHSSDLVINKQAYRGKNDSDRKVKLSIVQDQVIKIEKGNSITWTFELERKLFKISDFENFVVRKSHGKYTYFLVSYLDIKNRSVQEHGKSFSFEIPEEKLNLENIPLQASRTALDWAPTDDGGGGGINNTDPCEGVWIPEYGQCNAGGKPDGHGPAEQ